MSNRSWDTESLVLQISSSDDEHRHVSLLVPQEHSCTIIRAILFGGARSKLRGMVAPYQSGRVWLYSNPITSSHKITDFAVSAYRMELRESLVRSWCAAVCSEITVKICGTGSWQITNAFLDGLCTCDDEGCKRALLRFLWRLLHHAGLAPPLSVCGICGRPLIQSAHTAEAASYSGVHTADAPAITGTLHSTDTRTAAACSRIGESGTHHILEHNAIYTPIEDVFLCPVCAPAEVHGFALSAEALSYLYAVSEKAASFSRHLPLSLTAYGELKRFLFFLTEKMIGSPLKTFQIGYGFL